MTRTIIIDIPGFGPRHVPVSRIETAGMRDGRPVATLEGFLVERDVLNIATEAELLAALGWSSAPPPPHPTARTLLDVLRDLHVDGALAACHYGDDAPLDHAVSEWAAAGYPGARRQP